MSISFPQHSPILDNNDQDYQQTYSDHTTQNGNDIDSHNSDLDDEVIESSLLDNGNPGNQSLLYDAQISPQTSPSATYRTTTSNPIEQAHLQIPLTRRAPLPTSSSTNDDPLRSRITVTRDERKAELRAMLKEEGRIASALERIASALEARQG